MKRCCSDGPQDRQGVPSPARLAGPHPEEIVDAGKDAYEGDDLLQEAVDSLMMKIGEAANRLSRAGVAGPKGVEWSNAIDNRNWLIHQYDQIDREITWATLTKSLAAWRRALADTFDEAESSLAAEKDTD